MIFRFFGYIILLSLVLQSCASNEEAIERPKDVWAFRSVLDRKPRMFTIALDTDCYVSYDLANCRIYKVWKGGVDLDGAAFTDKKNVQPTSWGTAYSDSLHSKWGVEINGIRDSFKIVNKGYRLKNNQVFLRYLLLPASGDTIEIVERPEVLNNNGNRVLERLFITSDVPESAKLTISSPISEFVLQNNTSSSLKIKLAPLPEQVQPHEEGEYDHRGRYYMEKSDCFTCHEIDKKTVGPSLREIAGRYKNEENGMARLIAKVRDGGSGVWGTSVMNAHPGHTESEIRIMLDYVLTLAPSSSRLNAPAEMPVGKTEIKTSPGFGAPLEAVHPSYDVRTIHKADFKPRVGALAFTNDGKLLVSTWDSVGAVYMLEGVETGDTNKIKVKRIASGLAEPLGMEVVDNEIYVLQKQELTRLTDDDGDDVIDTYEAVCNSWGATSDFHEFAFGLVYKDGFFYATLSMAMRLMSHEKQQPDRGRTIKISRDGTYETLNYGLRTPNGIGVGVDNELFVTDNQGEWVPANKLIHVKRGEYHGMRWGHLDNSQDPPEVALPAVWLPENEIGNSPSEPVFIEDGVYKGQMLHGDVTYGGIQRDFLEKINGQYQGAVFRFTQGLEAGVNRMRWGPDGSLYIGGVGMVGGWSWKEKQFGLQKMTYNGKPTFDILAIRLQQDGFEIELTEPLTAGAVKPNDILIQQWWYLPTADYGGPKKDLEKLEVKHLELSPDRKKISLVVPGLREKRVVYFRLPKLMSEAGRPLWSGEAWYTLNMKPAQNSIASNSK